MKHLLRAFALASLAVLACDTPTDPETEGGIGLAITVADNAVEALQRVEQARARIEGPSGENSAIVTRTLTIGGTDTLSGFTPGSYQVAVEGIEGGDLTVYGETSVTVTAGANRTASVNLGSFAGAVTPFAFASTTALNFTVEFAAVPRAAEYDIQWSPDPGFSTVESITTAQTSAVISVNAAGSFFFRVRAQTKYGINGPWSATESVDVVPDTFETSGSDLGFLTPGTPTTLTDLNIVPEDDVDLFQFTACVGDFVSVDLRAGSLSPPSTLNPILALIDASAGTIASEAAADPRVEGTMASTGSHSIRVEADGGSTVGRYELDITVTAGPANNGTSCGTPGVPAALRFTSEPSNTVAGSTLSPVIVEVIDGPGDVVTAFSGDVSVDLAALPLFAAAEVANDSAPVVSAQVDDAPAVGAAYEPPSAELLGTLTRAAVNGVATFDDLTIIAAGSFGVVASASAVPDASPVTTTPFTIEPAPAEILDLVAGDNQVGEPGTPLGAPLVVVVTDVYGNPIGGVDVAWNVTGGGGSLSASATTTDDQGQTQVDWTLGSAGGQTVSATVDGLTNSPVVFNATAANIVTWVGTADGNWHEPTNWDTGNIPTALDAVVIGGTGSLTITVDQSAVAASVVMNASGIILRIESVGDLTVSGPIANDAGQIEVVGTAQALAIANADRLALLGGSVTTDVVNTGTMTVAATGSVTGNLDQRATLSLVPPAGSPTLNVSGNLLNSGTISLAAADAGSTADLDVTGTLVNGANGAIQIEGTAGGGFIGASALQNAGALVVDSPEGVSITAVTVGNTGDINLATAGLNFDVSGGGFTNDGTITVGDGQTIGVFVGAFTNTANGTVSLNTGSTLDLTNSVVQLEGGLDLSTSSAFVYFDGSSTGGQTVSLGGDLIIGVTSVLDGVATGFVSANGSIVRVQGTASFDGTSFTTATLQNDGSVDFYAGTSAIETYVAQTTSNLGVDAATLSFTNGVALNHFVSLSSSDGATPATLNGVSSVQPSGAIEVSDNPGAVITGAFSNSGTVTVQSSTNGLTVQAPDPGGDGLYELIGGPVTIQATGGYSNSGTIFVGPGQTFTIDAPGWLNFPTGVLTGSGTITYTSGSFTSQGTIAPGQSTGVLTLDGDVVFDPGSSLEIEVFGTTLGSGYDRLAVTGNVTIDGTLDILTDGFLPTAGDRFSVITFATSSGSFTTITGDALSNGTALIPEVGATEFDLLNAVPAGSVTLNPDGVSVSVGSTIGLAAEVRDGQGNLIPNPIITWASLNPDIATVDASGTVTPVASGQVVMSASSGGSIGYGVVTVSDPGATPVNLWAADVTSATGFFEGIWGTASDNVYAAGSNFELYRWNGSAWTTVAGPPTASTGQYSDVWGTSPSDIYLTESVGTVFHWNGTEWSEVPGGNCACDIWGAAPNDVFFVGGGGRVHRWDGESWTTMTSSTTEDLFDVWGSSASDVWAVGRNGAIIRYDGNDTNTWRTVDPGIAIEGTQIFGTGPDFVVVVGNVTGTEAAIQYNGTAWSQMPGAALLNLKEVWGTSPTEFFAYEFAGVNPTSANTIHKFDGTTWQAAADVRQVSTTQFVPGGSWGISNGPVVLGGSDGVLLRGHRGGTVELTSPGPAILTGITTSLQLEAVARDRSGNVVSVRAFSWTSDNPSVVAVDPLSGLAGPGGANGTATITAAAPGGASAEIVVENTTALHRWINGQGGSWQDPANWNSGIVPNVSTHPAGDTIVIDLAGDYTITDIGNVGLGTPADVLAQLMVTPGSGTQTLVFNAAASGQIDVNVDDIIVGARATLDFTSARITVNDTFNNLGTLLFRQGGSVRAGSSDGQTFTEVPLKLRNDLSGVMQFQDNADITFGNGLLSDGTIRLGGTAGQTATIRIANGTDVENPVGPFPCCFENLSSGIIETFGEADAAILMAAAPASLQNQGTIRTDGTGTLRINADAPFNAGTGSILVTNGDLVLGGTRLAANANLIDIRAGRTLTRNGGGLSNNTEGTILGAGTLDVSAVSFANLGTIAPGGSPGVFTVVGDVAMGTTSNLQIEIEGLTAGTEHDQLVVTGGVAIDGNLGILTPGAFIPESGDQFPIMTYGSATGGFATGTGQNLANGTELFINVGATVTSLIDALPIAYGEVLQESILDGLDADLLTFEFDQAALDLGGATVSWTIPANGTTWDPSTTMGPFSGRFLPTIPNQNGLPIDFVSELVVAELGISDFGRKFITVTGANNTFGDYTTSLQNCFDFGASPIPERLEDALFNADCLLYNGTADFNADGGGNTPFAVVATVEAQSAGQQIQVDLISTGDGASASVFDPVLLVYDSDGAVVGVGDDIDFTNENYNARVQFTAAAAGFFTMVLTNFNEGDTGPFVLAINEGFTSPNVPVIAAPAPVRSAINVISLFSNQYVNETVDTWSTSTDVATVADIQIDGNDVKQYTGLNFAEIEFTSAPIDASAMTHLHLDIWTPNPTSAGFLQIRLVDLGGDNTPGGVDDTQGEVQSNTTDAVVGNYNGSTLEASATGKWLSVDLPLSTFTANGLASLTNLGQMRIAGNLSTLFIDNMYFYNEPAAATASGLTDTDPASGAGDAHRAFRGANPEATRQALRDLGIQGTAPTGKEKN